MEYQTLQPYSEKLKMRLQLFYYQNEENDNNRQSAAQYMEPKEEERDEEEEWTFVEDYENLNHPTGPKGRQMASGIFSLYSPFNWRAENIQCVIFLKRSSTRWLYFFFKKERLRFVRVYTIYFPKHKSGDISG